MKALVVENPGHVVLRNDVPEPEIDEYQALCKNLACGLCNGTDIKIVNGGLRHFNYYPCVLGHEAVGQIIHVGTKVRSFHVGDRVVRSCLSDRSGLYSLWGGFAEYGFVDDWAARMADGVPANEGFSTHQILPPEIDGVDGVMIVTLKEVASALNRLGLQPGMDTVIAGDGPVGLAMAALSRLKGAKRVVLLGHHTTRLETARRLGADAAVDTRREDAADFLRRMLPEKADLFVDCVGRISLLNQGMQVIKDAGKVGVYGIGPHAGDAIDWDAAPYNFTLHSVQWPIASEERAVHDEVCRWVTQGRLNLKEFVTHRLPVDAYREGFRLVDNREGLKVALTFGE